jgi:hypothetical protein
MGKQSIASGTIRVWPIKPGTQGYLANGKRVEVVRLATIGRRCQVKFYDVRDGPQVFWVDWSDLAPR